MTEWSIRAAAPPDIAGVLALWERAEGRPSVSDTREGIALLLARDPEGLLIAERDGALVGSLIAAWDGWRASFYRLAVDPDHRRQGIGSALVAEGERRLLRRGAVRMTAIVGAEDPRARDFWCSLGYRREPKQARFVKNCTSPRPSAR